MEDLDCVVSLTSWKGRIYHPDVPKVIYSIIRQKTHYKFKVVLVLSSDEFPKKDAELPDTIKLLAENDLIEILWFKENIKAYKKYYPTHMKYKNVPIITTDDDIFLSEDFVETFMNIHKKNPSCILYEDGFNYRVNGKVFTISAINRLFPPNSLYELDYSYFTRFFNNMEDDAYIACLQFIKKTPVKIVHTRKSKVILNEFYESTAFYKEYIHSPRQRNMMNLLKELNIV